MITLSIVQHQILWSKLSSPIVSNRPKNSVWNSGRLCQSLPHWRNYWRACFSRHLPLRLLGSIPVPHSHPWAYTSNTSHSQFLSLSKGLVCGLCGWGVDRNSFKAWAGFSLASPKEAWHAVEKSSATCEVTLTLFQNLVRCLCREHFKASQTYFWHKTCFNEKMYTYHT